MNFKSALSATIVGATMMMAGTAYAQTAVSSVPVFNTGVDANRNIQADGTRDTHYVATTGNNSSATAAQLAGLGATQAYVYSNANYITPANSTLTPAAFISQGPSGASTAVQTTYSTTFDLTGFTRVQVTGRFSADNGAVAYLNGFQIAATDTSTDMTSFTASYPFGATSPFVAGTNILSFVVTNFGGVPGSTSNPAGLFVTNLLVNGDRAVPGPIAGAGLPVLLGLAGAAFVRRRRMAA